MKKFNLDTSRKRGMGFARSVNAMISHCKPKMQGSSKQFFKQDEQETVRLNTVLNRRSVNHEVLNERSVNHKG